MPHDSATYSEPYDEMAGLSATFQFAQGVRPEPIKPRRSSPSVYASMALSKAAVLGLFFLALPSPPAAMQQASQEQHARFLACWHASPWSAFSCARAH